MLALPKIKLSVWEETQKIPANTIAPMPMPEAQSTKKTFLDNKRELTDEKTSTAPAQHICCNHLQTGSGHNGEGGNLVGNIKMQRFCLYLRLIM